MRMQSKIVIYTWGTTCIHSCVVIFKHSHTKPTFNTDLLCEIMTPYHRYSFIKATLFIDQVQIYPYIHDRGREVAITQLKRQHGKVHFTIKCRVVARIFNNHTH